MVRIVDYSEAIKRPFTDLKTLLIGFVINLIPIVNFAMAGYELECAKSAFKKNYKLPSWSNFGKLFVRGFLILVIGLVYMIPMIIFLGVAASRVVIKSDLLADYFKQPNLYYTELFKLLAPAAGYLVLAIIFMILAMYVLPIAIIRYGEKNKFSESFKIGLVFKKAFNGSYFIVWLLMILFSMIVSMILGFIPYVGGAFASFISGVALFTAIGEIYPSLK